MDPKAILAAIRDAVTRLKRDSMNEANTRIKVIDKILDAVGYLLDDLDREEVIGGGKPDYTVLPIDAHRFYLEAKAPGEVALDKYAGQVTTYAFQNGSRWAVLTNGMTWRLYDTHIKQPTDRMICEVRLENEDQAVSFLAAMSKESVLSDGLEAFGVEAQQRRAQEAEEAERVALRSEQKAKLHKILEDELRNSESGLMLAIHDNLKKRDGLSAIDVNDILAHFRRDSVNRVDASERNDNPINDDSIGRLQAGCVTL